MGNNFQLLSKKQTKELCMDGSLFTQEDVSALHMACFEGTKDKALELINQGTAKSSKSGGTPLHMKGHMDTALMLIEQGAKLTEKTSKAFAFGL